MNVMSFMEEDQKEIIGNSDEWLKKVKELGLEGQETLCEPDKSPVPFRLMDAELTAIIDALCPEYENYKKYSGDPFPMQVLGHIAFAEREGHFEEMRVRYHRQKPDPFLIGKRNGKWYLICQWGPEKLSLDELKERAKAYWREKTKANLEAAIEEAKAQLNSLDALVVKNFNGEWFRLVS